MSLWGHFSHRVIPCGFIIAQERDIGNCQMGTLVFRGNFSKKFRKLWPKRKKKQKGYKFTGSKSENESRKMDNLGKKYTIETIQSQKISKRKDCSE